MVSGAQGDDAKTAANTKTVNDLYRELLGRDADEGGLDYYRSQLAAGAKPEDIARNIISGAKAGSEASEISQAEYDKYFRPTPPTPTSTATTGNLTPTELASLAAKAAGNVEAASELTNYAQEYLRNNTMNTELFADDIRDGFFYDVITNRPDLIGDLVGEANLAQYQLAEGGYNTQAMVSELKSALGSDVYSEIANNIGDFIGAEALGAIGDFADMGGDPIMAIAGSILRGDNFSETAASVGTALVVSAAVDMGAVALASLGIPGAGPFIAAALALDGVLSKALGYDSPIQDGIGWVANQLERGAEWLSDTFGDIWGGVEDFVGGIGDFFSGIGDWFAEGGAVRFQEGGLVDFPSESAYNYTDYYGAMGQPQLSLDQVQPEMAFAGGGLIPLLGGGKIAKGPGGGLDDLIPTSIDGRRAAALSDGEFVIPADVVSMMGDGSSDAGAKRFYDLVKQIRQHKTGTEKQAGPLPVGKILERTIS